MKAAHGTTDRKQNVKGGAQKGDITFQVMLTVNGLF